MADTKNKNKEAETEEQDPNTTYENPEIDSKYRMILLAAQRAKQLQKGAHPRVTTDIRKAKLTRVALEELSQDKIKFEITEPK